MMNQQNARAKIHCIFYRDFKTWSSAIVRQRKKRRWPRWMQRNKSKNRRRRLGNNASSESRSRGRREAALEELGEEAIKAIVAKLSKENKSSAVEQDKAIQQFKRASKSNKNRTVSSVHLADMTPWMEGAIILSYLTATNNSKEFIIAELEQRKSDARQHAFARRRSQRRYR
eukprot:scaffold9874_cov51-Cyclotella_meneghiniana.AAC.10